VAAGQYQHVQGKWNVEDKNLAHIVGGGSSDTDRKNIYTLDWQGNAEFAGKVYSGGKELAPLEDIPIVPPWALADTKPSYAASEVGAIQQQAHYINSPESADNVTRSYVLLNLGDQNPALKELLGTNYAYILTQYYASNPGYRVQTAWSYAANTVRMAIRQEYYDTWYSWQGVANRSDIPSVPAWALASSKPSYTANEVGAVPTTSPYIVDHGERSSIISYTTSNVTHEKTFIYKYRKWSDGTAEVFGTSVICELWFKTAWGTALVENESPITFSAYPFTFNTVKYCNVSYIPSPGANMAVVQSVRPISGIGINANPGQTWLFRAGTPDQYLSSTGYITLYTVGTWK